MAEKPRSRSAKLRASHGRAERLRREAGDAVPDKASARSKARDPSRPLASRPARPKAYTGQSAGRSVGRDHPSVTLDRIRERVSRAQAAADKRREARLKEQTRAEFTSTAERRRDMAGRDEHERKRQATQAVLKRAEDSHRRHDQRQTQQRREEQRRQFNRAAGHVIHRQEIRDALKRAEDARRRFNQRQEQQRREARRKEFNRKVERRKDAARRIDQAARQKEQQRRAAAEIDREQKQRAADQKAAHRHQADVVRSRQQGERNSFRVNEATAEHRHHNAIKGLDDRKDRELDEFDGRRRGLVGRIAELVPGRREENDRQRAAIETRYEQEKWTKHRDFEAFKERAFAAEQKKRIEHFQELKALRALHGEERSEFGLKQAQDRPRLIEGRVRVIERADQDREQARERDQERPGQPKDQARPAAEFSRAASNSASDPASPTRYFVRDAGQEVLRPALVLERA